LVLLFAAPGDVRWGLPLLWHHLDGVPPSKEKRLWRSKDRKTILTLPLPIRMTLVLSFSFCEVKTINSNSHILGESLIQLHHIYPCGLAQRLA
jgi:hypothetical protein